MMATRTAARINRRFTGLPFLLHGFLFTVWFVLLFVQARLVARHRVYLHRKLGIVGAVLAPLSACVAILVSYTAGRRFVLAHPTCLGLRPSRYRYLRQEAVLCHLGGCVAAGRRTLISNARPIASLTAQPNKGDRAGTSGASRPMAYAALTAAWKRTQSRMLRVLSYSHAVMNPVPKICRVKNPKFMPY
jgi:hypothetical protein